jgi:hypothetical protein
MNKEKVADILFAIFLGIVFAVLFAHGVTP